jgi:hypothetical protein
MDPEPPMLLLKRPMAPDILIGPSDVAYILVLGEGRAEIVPREGRRTSQDPLIAFLSDEEAARLPGFLRCEIVNGLAPTAEAWLNLSGVMRAEPCGMGTAISFDLAGRGASLLISMPFAEFASAVGTRPAEED